MGTSAWWTDPQQLQVISTWANIGLTAGLLAFAFMQWWVSHAAEKQRRREREADEARELETAYAVLRATAFETWAKLHELEGIDLARISREGLLKPADFLPVAPITVVQSAAKLGPLPSQLTQTGLNLLRDARRCGRGVESRNPRRRHWSAAARSERHAALGCGGENPRRRRAAV